MISLPNTWSKIILIICLSAILNLAVVIPVAQAYLVPVNDIPKNAGDIVWRTIRTLWHIVDSNARLVTAISTAWEKTREIRRAALNYALQITLTVLLNMITNDIVNWIKYGTTPRFITEGPWAYLKKAADNALGYFIDEYLNAGYLCEPFALNLKIALANPPTFQERAACTLSDMGRNLHNFFSDFRHGGWREWSHLVDNNFYSSYITTEEELAALEAKTSEENKQDIEAGKGFLSMKSCRWFDANGQQVQDWKPMAGRGFPKPPSECKDGNVPLPCQYECRTETPSSVISSMTNKVINEPIDRLSRAIANLIGDNPYKVYLITIADAIIWRAMHEVGGLFHGTSGKYDSLNVKYSTSTSTTPEWDNDFNPSQISSSTQNINSNLGEDASEIQGIIHELDSLESNIQSNIQNASNSDYLGILNQNLGLERQISNLYNYLSSEVTQIKAEENNCSSTPYASFRELPDWTNNISYWQKWIDGKIIADGQVQENLQKILDAIPPAQGALEKFQQDFDSYDEAASKCQTMQCLSDPDIAEKKHSAEEKRGIALGKINNILTLAGENVGENKVSSLSKADPPLQRIIKNIGDLSFNEKTRQGSKIAPDSPEAAHPNNDGTGSWSGTLYGLLDGSDITSKKTELDGILDQVRIICSQTPV